MVKEWTLIEEKPDKDYRVFKVNTLRAISPRTHAIGEFYTIETNDWVNVIPLTENKEVVMIKQFRHGSKKITLEIPGGLVDDEHHMEAALRELSEETGYIGKKVTYLGAVNPNPAIFNNLCHTYLVEDVKKTQEKDLDPDEDIEVVLVPLSEVPLLINKGIINHALVVVAFYLYFSKNRNGVLAI